tara:strand:- start:139 stop:894 length:756 start_codon:yes stop_codon:yes gene_type:complete
MKKYSYVTGKENFWVEISDNKTFKLLGSIYDSNPKKEEIDSKDLKSNFCIPFKKNKVIGLAFNYKSMMKKKENYDEPLIFFKSNTSLISDNNEIKYPKFVSKIWIEAELCLIIGKEGKNIEEKNAKNFILGHTCGNDVTAENIINRDWHLARSKALDTFAPVGPYLIKDLRGDDLEIKSSINGNVTQKSRTSDRILNDNQCVSLISKYFTLYPGDIIFTGTPAGATNAIAKPGDIVEIEIEKIGKLTNKVL